MHNCDQHFIVQINKGITIIMIKVLDSRLDVQPNDTLHWGVGGEVTMMVMVMMVTRLIDLSTPIAERYIYYMAHCCTSNKWLETGILGL